jgi:hypothetical protein
MIDRYTKLVLSVIAAALLYLCVLLTPFPAVHAQNTQRPGESSGPVQAVIVGWGLPQDQSIPVTVVKSAPVTIAAPVQVRGTVTTERSSGAADRVVLVGWEEGAVREKPNSPMRAITPVAPGLPVTVVK